MAKRLRRAIASGIRSAKIPESRSVSCSCVSIFWRLLGFLRPYRSGVIWSLVLAALAMVATVAIPWLTGQAIDRVDAGDESDLRRYAALIALAAVARVRFF